jgi:hypothetical protein
MLLHIPLFLQQLLLVLLVFDKDIERTQSKQEHYDDRSQEWPYRFGLPLLVHMVSILLCKLRFVFLLVALHALFDDSDRFCGIEES